MKKLEYKGRTFFYKIESYECGDYGIFNCYETIFYKFIKTNIIKKYWLFGPDVEHAEYKELFSLTFNVEDNSISKKELRHELDKKVVLLDRYDEIKNGGLI
jgi:hypothetical protein